MRQTPSCPLCGDPPEHVKCFVRSCPSIARATDAGIDAHAAKGGLTDPPTMTWEKSPYGGVEVDYDRA